MSKYTIPAHRKYIVVSHTTISNYFKYKLLDKLGKFLDRTFFKSVLLFSDQIIAVSQTNKNFLVKDLKINPDKITVIYNGFSTKKVQNFKTDLYKRKEVVFATKWIPVKDPQTTFAAFWELAQRYPDWKFKFIGRGEIGAELSPQTKLNLPQNLEIINRFYTQDELFSLLDEASIYVNSSLNEGLSVGVIEAAAMGAIPVLSDAPANLEVAGKLDTVQFTFRRQDPADLVQTTEKAMLAMEENNLSKSSKLLMQLKSNVNYHFADHKVFADYYAYLKNYALAKFGLKYPNSELDFFGREYAKYAKYASYTKYAHN